MGSANPMTGCICEPKCPRCKALNDFIKNPPAPSEAPAFDHTMKHEHAIGCPAQNDPKGGFVHG